jgi:hypothetical protein
MSKNCIHSTINISKKYNVNSYKTYINISINKKSIYRKFIKIYYSWLTKNNFEIKKSKLLLI